MWAWFGLALLVGIIAYQWAQVLIAAIEIRNNRRHNA